MVDMPIEESGELDRASKEHGLDVIRLVAPSTTDSRIQEIASRGSGFLYAVSAAGVTGARASLSDSAVSLLKRTVPASPLPVVLGFGISSPGHVREAITAGARGVVEGSALVSAYAPFIGNSEQALGAIASHAAGMKAATMLR
jgi:tryptophan synthase alpha chain